MTDDPDTGMQWLNATSRALLNDVMMDGLRVLSKDGKTKGFRTSIKDISFKYFREYHF